MRTRLAGTLFGVAIVWLEVGCSNGIFPGPVRSRDNGAPVLPTSDFIGQLDSTWTPQWDHVIGYWRLSAAAGTTATLSNGSDVPALVGPNGTVRGSPDAVLSFINSETQSGLNMDGKAAIDLGASLVPKIQNSFSFCAWVQVFGVWSDKTLISFNNNGGSSASLYVDGHGLLRFWYGNATPPTTVSHSTVDDGLWHHVGFTFDGNTTTYYIDGRVDNEGSLEGVEIKGPGIQIGGILGGSSLNHRGGLSEPAIWNTVLTPAEIKTIFDRQSLRKH